ncbi:hypothetical protein H2200_011682 [Cladophialophora chaetospira]|uniref:HAD superfamily hydrolase n=1 Tax=Cladophialophora chaetospira TaxID=386627 RepID=A0AA39CDE2_9EURO|nr:hypothetical protein H2200_011682 [Cladophialophora chaetospira]
MSASTSLSSEKTGKRKPRQFAPLYPHAKHGHDLPKLRGIVFDVDGTLCLPQNYMFKEMRAALDISPSIDILDHVRSLPNEPDTVDSDNSATAQTDASSENHSTTTSSQPPATDLVSPSLSINTPPSSPQARAVAKIQAIERRAMTTQRPQPGLQSLMSYLTRRNIPKALCTRNFPAPVDHLLEHFLHGEEFGTFEPIITRDTEGISPKPSPEGLWRIAQHWGLDKDTDGIGEYVKVHGGGDFDPLELARRFLGSGLIMVGDSIDDMAAGYRAGAATVLLVNEENVELTKHRYTGRSVRRLDELIDILEEGFVEEG